MIWIETVKVPRVKVYNEREDKNKVSGTFYIFQANAPQRFNRVIPPYVVCF